MNSGRGRRPTRPSGVLPVEKPAGITSHDVVDRVRKILGLRRVGHTGTLDPLAEGLLVLCVGTATRFAGYISRLGKSYRAVVRLGVSTTTDDAEGEPVDRYEGDLAGLVAVRDLAFELEHFRGRQQQLPPAFSAKKIDGVPAYELARRGEKPPLEPAEVEIYSLRLLGACLPDLDLEIDCSSGTYIRSLARDLGQRLGCGAHLLSLVRTRVGGFSLEDARSLDELEELGDRNRAGRALLTLGRALEDFPAVTLDEAGVIELSFGRVADCAVKHGGPGNGPTDTGGEGRAEVAMYDSEGNFLGIGELDRTGESMMVRPRRLNMDAFQSGFGARG